jgi:hypothetical protein
VPKILNSEISVKHFQKLLFQPVPLVHSVPLSAKNSEFKNVCKTFSEIFIPVSTTGAIQCHSVPKILNLKISAIHF